MRPEIQAKLQKIRSNVGGPIQGLLSPASALRKLLSWRGFYPGVRWPALSVWHCLSAVGCHELSLGLIARPLGASGEDVPRPRRLVRHRGHHYLDRMVYGYGRRFA